MKSKIYTIREYHAMRNEKEVRKINVSLDFYT